VLAARNTDRLQSYAHALREIGGEVIVKRVDAADANQVAELVRKNGDTLSVLHYNAGVLNYDAKGGLQLQSIDTQPIESLVSDLQVNVSSALAAIQAALSSMSVRRAGTILLTGGGLGVDPSPDLLTLSIGKAGIRTTARALFEPLKERGIHIATVTVATLVSPQSTEASDVADALWNLHAQPAGAWQWEARYPNA
jgi:short-subunit dehydrogenase